MWRCRECKLSNAELVVFPCLEVACISVSFRHKQTITTSCARTTTFPLGRTNSLRCSSAPRHAVLLTSARIYFATLKEPAIYASRSRHRSSPSRLPVTLTPTGALAKDASPQPVMLSLWEVEHLLGNPRSSLRLRCLRLKLNTWHFRPLLRSACGSALFFLN